MRDSFCGKKLRTMTLTATFVSVMSFLMLQTDYIIVGKLINQQAVGAITLSSPFKSFADFISVLISGGTVSCILSENGKLHKNRANAYFTNGLIASVVAGLLLFAAAIPIGAVLLDPLGSNTMTHTFASRYYSRYVYVALLYPLYTYLQAVVYVEGDELLYTGSFLVGLIGNIFFSVRLCRTMGIAGIALGSVIGIAAGTVLLGLHFLPGRSGLKVNLRISRRKLRLMTENGFTSASSMLFSAIFMALLNRFYISHYGDISLSVLTVASNIFRLSSVLAGVCAAAAPFIALYSGENNVSKLNGVLRHFRRELLLFALTAVLLIMLLAPQIVKLFGIRLFTLADEAERAARIVSLGLFGSALTALVFSYHSTSGSLPFACLMNLLQELAVPGLVVLPAAVLKDLDGMWVGFAVTPYLVIALLSLKIRINGTSLRELFFIENREPADVCSFELRLTPESVIKLRDDVDALLESRKASKSLRNRISVMIEDVYMLIIEVNDGRELTGECTLSFGDDILLVLKDDGRQLDVTNPDLPVSSIRSFTVSCIMEHHAERISLSMLCCNRNAFRFSR